MTENVKHDIDVMRDVYMSREQRAAYERIVAMAIQREAAGDGEGDLEARAKAMFEERNGGDSAPWERQWEPTREFWRKKAATTPASAEPGEVLDDEGRCRCGCTESCTHAAELRAELNRTRTVVQRMIAEDNELYAKEHHDARGGVEAVTWLVRNHATGSLELAEPNEKASNPEHWSDAFPVYTHPTPAALDAEKVRTMVRDAIVEEVLAHPDDAVVDGPDFADAVLARFAIDRAGGGERENGNG